MVNLTKIKSLFLCCIVIGLTLLSVRVYFHSGVPDTHDGDAHLARFANYKIALRQLQIPPRFAPNLVNNYGYPVFNYNYPLANILSVPFSVIGFPYALTYKLLFTTMIALGFWGVVTLLRLHKLSTPSIVTAVSVLAVSPFLTNLILVRGNTGEMMAWGLLPWLFYSVDWLIQHTGSSKLFWQKPGVFLCWLLWTAFLLSHNVTVLFTLPLVFAYAAFRFQKEFSLWKKLILIVLLAVLSTLWFWLPAMAEKSLVTLDTVGTQHEFNQHFPTLSQLLFSPIQFGYSYFGSVDSMTFQIGFVQWFILIISLILGIKMKLWQKQKAFSSVWWFCLLFSGLLILLQLKVTNPIWQTIPLANYIQFPWRLSIFVSLLLALLTAFSYPYLSTWVKRGVWFLIVLQGLVMLQVQPRAYLVKSDLEYELYSQSTSTSHENTPKSFTYLGFSDWAPHPFVVSGEAEYQVQHWTGSDKKYTLQVTQEAVIAEPTMNFAGWQTTANDQKVDYLNDDTIQGRIAFELPPGEYQIHSQFTQWTWPRIIGNSVSLITLLTLLGWVGWQFWQTKRTV